MNHCLARAHILSHTSPGWSRLARHDTCLVPNCHHFFLSGDDAPFKPEDGFLSLLLFFLRHLVAVNHERDQWGPSAQFNLGAAPGLSQRQRPG